MASGRGLACRTRAESGACTEANVCTGYDMSVLWCENHVGCNRSAAMNKSEKASQLGRSHSPSVSAVMSMYDTNCRTSFRDDPVGCKQHPLNPGVSHASEILIVPSACREAVCQVWEFTSSSSHGALTCVSEFPVREIAHACAQVLDTNSTWTGMRDDTVSFTLSGYLRLSSWVHRKTHSFLDTKEPSATNFRFFDVLPALMAGDAAGRLSKNPAHHEPLTPSPEKSPNL